MRSKLTTSIAFRPISIRQDSRLRRRDFDKKSDCLVEDDPLMTFLNLERHANNVSEWLSPFRISLLPSHLGDTVRSTQRTCSTPFDISCCKSATRTTRCGRTRSSASLARCDQTPVEFAFSICFTNSRLQHNYHRPTSFSSGEADITRLWTKHRLRSQLKNGCGGPSMSCVTYGNDGSRRLRPAGAFRRWRGR